MKNIFVFYAAILIPLPLMFWVAKSGDSMWFTILLFTYIPYRTITDGLRLVNMKRMRWNEYWKLWVPWEYIKFKNWQ